MIIFNNRMILDSETGLSFMTDFVILIRQMYDVEEENMATET